MDERQDKAIWIKMGWCWQWVWFWKVVVIFTAVDRNLNFEGKRVGRSLFKPQKSGNINGVEEVANC